MHGRIGGGCYADRAPIRDQLFVQRVELVSLGERRQHGLLQPAPLDNGRLEQRGRRVGVVLEQLGRIDAVVGEIEAARERRLSRAP